MSDPGTFLVGLIFFVLSLAVLWTFSKMATDVRKIREHLDRVIPDVVKANKARIREQLQEPEPVARVAKHP
jgi:CHASE3 domain sensor protein